MQTSPAQSDPAPISPVEQELEDARTRLEARDTPAAIAVCQKHLGQDLTLREACALSNLLRETGQTDAADTIRSTVISTIEQSAANATLPYAGYRSEVELLLSLQAFDAAVTLCEQACDRAPEDPETMNTLVALLINLDRIHDAQTATKTYFERNPGQSNALVYMATIFSHVGARAFTLELLKFAEMRSFDSSQQAQIDYLLAANGAKGAKLDQHGMAVSFFDEFADGYDEKLKTLGNNGPALVFDALKELNLPKSKKHRILDAGCGTGLCAGFLRRFAKHLMGVDISVAMLEKSRSRSLYDHLARTDLSIRATYPDGPYDIVVCADVLVYFGALDSVFANFHDVLAPGGWLLFTVEDETDPTVRTGFKLYPSGRHKHREPYLVQTLSRTGFPKPRLIRHARLRNEMEKPVMGTVIAVQKTALAFG